MKIDRLIRFSGVIESARLILDDRGRRHGVRFIPQAGIERGGIHKRLKNAARRSFRNRVIQLAHAIIAAPDQRFYFSGMRIKADQRDLRFTGCLARCLAAPGKNAVDFAHSQGYRFRRVALQIQIKRGVNARAGLLKIAVLKVVNQAIIHQIDKIGRIRRFNTLAGRCQRSSHRCPVLVLRDVSVIQHLFQNNIPSLFRPLGIAHRIPHSRRLNDAGQRRGFRQRQASDIFPEVGLRRLAESPDRERPAMPKVNLIGVVLKDLFLRELLLQVKSNQQLIKLAGECFAAIQPKVARQLLRDGGSALRVTALFQIHKNRFDDAHGVEPGVLKKPFVFDGNDRMNQHGRKVIVFHQPAFFAVLVIQAAQQPGFQQVLRAGCIVPQRNNGRDLAVLEFQHSRLGA